jgi:hypothetical protein
MEIPPDMQISIADIAARGHCARLAQFFRSNGLRDQYARMIKGGTISAQELAATGDPRAIDVVRHKIEASNG